MTGKTWGPFTGAQLTVMVTTALLCLAIPGGLWAAGVQFTRVSLFDPKTMASARVIKGGAQLISDGAGPLTVDGSVMASDISPAGTPANFVRFFATPPSTGGCTPLFTAPASKAFILTRMILHMSAVPPAGRDDGFYIGSTCGGIIFEQILLTEVGVTTLDYGQGIVIPAGQTLSVSSTLPASILGIGYLTPPFVPAS